MGSRTPLYDKHVEAGARIVDFGGWDMPLHYGSQKEEHFAVRERAGVFDVSHMTIVDLAGERRLGETGADIGGDIHDRHRVVETAGGTVGKCNLGHCSELQWWPIREAT